MMMLIKTPWFQSNLAGVIIGFILSSIISIVIYQITSKAEKKKSFYDNIHTIIHSNSELFSLIFKGSVSENKIDYYGIRVQLEKQQGFIFLLPKNLREQFRKLNSIYMSDNFERRKKEIEPIISNIVKIIDGYGVGEC